MRHCYICNKAGVPIKDALCGECRATRKKWPLNSWATKIHTHFPHAFNFLAVPCGARKLSTSPDLKA